MSTEPKARAGRPRSFDADEALDRAVRVFWTQGYDGSSLTDLTAAMGISRTSLYAAFGDKQALFAKALQRYTEGPASYGLRALAEPTARAVAVAFLRGAVQASSVAGDPPGCLGVQGALAAGDSGRPARDALVAWREQGRRQLRDRFRTSVDQGDLPAGADPGQLARYLMTMANGIAVQAAGGTSRQELQTVADAALLGWPFIAGQQEKGTGVT